MNNLLVFVGNSCLDVLLQCDDMFLKSHSLAKSHLSNIKDYNQLRDIKSRFSNYKILSGGASANTAATLSHLGMKNIHFISNISNDYEGKSFIQSMKDSGVITHFEISEQDIDFSTQVLCFITPDGDRTFATYNGISKIFGKFEPPREILNNTRLLYLEGYALCSPYAYEYYRSAAEYVRSCGGDVCFNMGDRAIMEKYPLEVRDILSFCTGFICNIHEAKIVYGDLGNEQALCLSLMKDFKFGAITCGDKGAWGFMQNEFMYAETSSILNDEIIDSVGAGDHFAAGFLYGYLSNWSLEKICKFSNLCGGRSLMMEGARYTGDCGSFSYLTTLV